MRKTILITCALILSAQPALSENLAPWAEQTKAIGSIKEIPRGFLGRAELDTLVQTGEDLFSAKFTKQDGVGRPNATAAILPTKARRPAQNLFSRTAGSDSGSCASCHNDPIVGGAGDFVTNVFVSEGFTNADFDSTNPQFSNERGTNHLFGAGLIELLAREISTELVDIRAQALRMAKEQDKSIRQELISKGVSFGYITVHADGLVDLTDLDGIDTDLVIRPFSQKGVMTSLRQFTINAANHHHGMQATERFGTRWTGEVDFDEDGYKTELSPADISALVAWQATLRPPIKAEPENEEWKDAAIQGEIKFNDLGCASCHMPSLPLNSLQFDDPGIFDAAGTLQSYQVKSPATYDLSMLEWAKDLPRNDAGQILVPLFGDLKRHVMTDRQVDTFGNELMSQRFVDRNIFITAELWGIGSTAPYGHRNDITDLHDVIEAHGGAARQSRDAYLASSENGKSAIIAFLRTLEIK